MEQHPTGPTFDTLRAAEALQKAGFSDMQAKAVTHTIVAAQDNLATKADFRALRSDFRSLRSDFKALQAVVEANTEALRADNKRLLAAFESHIAVLRADNKRMEETLQTEMKSLKESVDSLKSLVMFVVLPLAMGAIAISLTLFGFVITRTLSG